MKNVLLIIGVVVPFTATLYLEQNTPKSIVWENIQYGDLAPLIGLPLVSILFAILLILKTWKEPEPTELVRKRPRIRSGVRVRSGVPRTAHLTNDPPRVQGLGD